MSNSKESTLMQFMLDDSKDKTPATLGLSASYAWRHDPRHLLFTLARYKFCAKMLSGKGSIYEAGSGDGTGVPILMQEVDSYLGVDLEAELVRQCKERYSDRGQVDFVQMDLTKDSPGKLFDACISIDVLEHIDQTHEDQFMQGLCNNLKKDAVCIIGTPNLSAKAYASKGSEIVHINLKDHEMLKELMLKYFKNVFLFSMNDEVVHTGFSPMAHYLMAVGVGKVD